MASGFPAIADCKWTRVDMHYMGAKERLISSANILADSLYNTRDILYVPHRKFCSILQVVVVIHRISCTEKQVTGYPV